MVEGETILTTNRLTVICCFECNVFFAIPERMQAERRKDKQAFYCPAGHAQAYVKSSIEQLNEQIASQADDLRYYRGRVTELQKEKDHKSRQLFAAKGVVTKIKKRIANGVCPCCKRTFKDLAQHMSGMHPDWAPDAEVAA